MHKSQMNDYRSGAISYLRHVLNETRETPTSLARKAGVSPTTLTRPLNDEDHKFTLSVGTLNKIMEATGYAVGPFLMNGIDALDRGLDIKRNPEVYEPALDDVMRGVSDYMKNWTPVIGTVQAGKWLEGAFLDEAGAPEPIVLLSYSEAVESFIVVMKGNSFNRVCQPGQMLLCARDKRLLGVLSEKAESPQTTGDVKIQIEEELLLSGNPVLLERTMKDSGLIEITPRVVRRLADGGLGCFHCSTDERFSGHVKVGETDGEIVRIIARVEYVFRRATDPDLADKSQIW